MEALGRLNARIFVFVLERVPAAENGWTWTFREATDGPPRSSRPRRSRSSAARRSS